jgi:hypothetical protein
MNKPFPPRTPIVVTAIMVAAICMVLTTSRAVMSDSVIPALISLYHWTPFYWGTARYGMLIPLLTSVVGNPVWNLFLQFLVSTALLFAAPSLMGRFIYGGAPGVVVGLATSVLLVCLYAFSSAALYANSTLILYSSPAQPYGMAVAFCFAGLCLIDERPLGRVWSWIAGSLFVVLAMWMCPTVAFSAAPIVYVVRAVPDIVGRAREAGKVQSTQRLVASLVFNRGTPLCLLLAAGAAFSAYLSHLASASEGAALVSLLAPQDWVRQGIVPRLFHGFLLWLVGPVRLRRAVFLAIPFVLIGALRFTKAGTRAFLLHRTAALLAGVLGEVVAFGSLAWVAQSLNPGHYLFVSLLLILMIPTGAIVVPLIRDREALAPFLPILFSAALVVAVLVGYGIPTVAKFRQGLEQASRGYSGDILRSGATFVAGDYWKVWPAVFQANARAYEAHLQRTVWGLSLRADTSRPAWDDFDAATHVIAVPAGDDIGDMARQLELTLNPGPVFGSVVTYTSEPREGIELSPHPPAWLHHEPTAGLTCFLDIVENKPSLSDTHGPRRLHVEGWAVEIGSDTVADAVTLELISAHDIEYFARAHIGRRPDVAARYHNPALLHAGFFAEPFSDGLPSDVYKIRILQRKDGRERFCEPDRNIQIQ